MSLYSGTPSYHNSITRPDDGLARAVATVNPAVEGLADRTAYLAGIVGGTDSTVITQAQTAFTVPTFGTWQTYLKMVFRSTSASGPDVTIQPPASPKDGDVIDFVVYSDSPSIGVNKLLKPDPADFTNAPDIVGGTYRYVYVAGLGMWQFAGSVDMLRTGWTKRLSAFNTVNPLPNALAGTVCSVAIDSNSSGLHAFKNGDTIAARASIRLTRTNVAAGADDNDLPVRIVLRRNGSIIANPAIDFPNESFRRQLLDGQSQQHFNAYIELLYTHNSTIHPLNGAWTVEVDWLIFGAVQVLNPNRILTADLFVDVTRGGDYA